jgi:hypothetical protein
MPQFGLARGFREAHLLFRSCRPSPASTMLVKGLMVDQDDATFFNEYCQQPTPE